MSNYIPHETYIITYTCPNIRSAWSVAEAPVLWHLWQACLRAKLTHSWPCCGSVAICLLHVDSVLCILNGHLSCPVTMGTIVLHRKILRKKYSILFSLLSSILFGFWLMKFDDVALLMYLSWYSIPLLYNPSTNIRDHINTVWRLPLSLVSLAQRTRAPSS